MENNKTALTRNAIYRFRNLRNAQSWVDHGLKPQWIMLGDDERFWVVTPADAARLEHQGYEFAA